VFFSGHKFLGGPGCPGVLIAKKKLLPPLDAVLGPRVGYRSVGCSWSEDANLD
jgi:selenocysteine lyase/cysteine desulfurase